MDGRIDGWTDMLVSRDTSTEGLITMSGSSTGNLDSKISRSLSWIHSVWCAQLNSAASLEAIIKKNHIPSQNSHIPTQSSHILNSNWPHQVRVCTWKQLSLWYQQLFLRTSKLSLWWLTDWKNTNSTVT